MSKEDVVFYHCTTRPRTSLAIWQKLRVIAWEILVHLPYSLDFAASDNHLLQFLRNLLNGINLLSMKKFENNLLQFFAQKPQCWDYGVTRKMEEDRLLQWLYLASSTTFPQFSDLNTAQVTVTRQNSSFIHMIQSASLYSNALWRGSQYKRKRKYQLQCPPRGICHSLAHRPPGSISRSCSSASPLAVRPLGAHMTDTTNKQTTRASMEYVVIQKASLFRPFLALSSPYVLIENSQHTGQYNLATLPKRSGSGLST